MALRGIKVIELVGLAPAPFCGLILSDFGANVIRVDKVKETKLDCLRRGKKSIAVDLKNEVGQKIFRKLCTTADVLIEPFRPGIMEKLNLGPEVLTKDNQRLIYARLTGFGQNGPLAKAAGHDINYLAISGILSLLGRKNEIPFPPINLLGDFGGGSLICALGICLSLIERNQTNKGQVIDANIVEGVNYLSSFIYHSKNPDCFSSTIVWPKADERGANTLDSGAPMYNVYKTKDEKLVAVGALEEKFLNNLIRKLNLQDENFSPFDLDSYDEFASKMQKVFITKTQDEWIKIFNEEDSINETCFTPVVEFDKSHLYEHNAKRNSFLPNRTPIPAPVLSRTPGKPDLNEPKHNQHTKEILLQLGYNEEEIHDLYNKKIISISDIIKAKL